MVRPSFGFASSSRCCWEVLVAHQRVTRRRNCPVVPTFGCRCQPKNRIFFTSQIIHFNRVFHETTPSILGGILTHILETPIWSCWTSFRIVWRWFPVCLPDNAQNYSFWDFMGQQKNAEQSKSCQICLLVDRDSLKFFLLWRAISTNAEERQVVSRNDPLTPP